MVVPEHPDDPWVTRIPLRFHPNKVPDFNVEDITLHSGDIVMIESRDRERFYTGGILGGGEHPLPRDYDLDILGAIAIAGGPVGSGGTGIGTAGRGGGGGGGGSGSGGATVNPSEAYIIRQVPGGQIAIRVNLNKALLEDRQRILIKPEDLIIVRYTFPEELYLAVLNLLQFNYLLNGSGGGGF